MDVLKGFLGIIMLISGLVLGLYVGVWWCFIGGIIQIVTNCTPDVNAMMIALGVGRFFISSLCGTLSAALLIIPGLSILKTI